MQCESPDLNSPELAGVLVYSNDTSPPLIIVDKDLISFLMDGVKNLKSNKDLVVYPDPEYLMFEEEGNLRKLEYGERRNIEIRVGGTNVTNCSLEAIREGCENVVNCLLIEI